MYIYQIVASSYDGDISVELAHNTRFTAEEFASLIREVCVTAYEGLDKKPKPCYFGGRLMEAVANKLEELKGFSRVSYAAKYIQSSDHDLIPCPDEEPEMIRRADQENSGTASYLMKQVFVAAGYT